MESKDNKVQGWISKDPAVGFWMITPSQEFRSGGPVKQDLTSHVGPIILSMFTSTHYTGMELDTKYRHGEAWKKVFGPVFVYLNNVPSEKDDTTLWDDAKKQMSTEESQWPYNNLTSSEDFPSADKRGAVSGQLVIRDRHMFDSLKWASHAYIGLAAPGPVGSWQIDSKGYQFWTRADQRGHFSIKNVRAGDYNLYAWVPGVIGDYKHEAKITITPPGSHMNLGVLRYDPPRNGPTLWEIGIPDRSAAEFFVPDPYPTLENKLFNNLTKQRYRQYGLWERYNDLYPKDDLIYTVGTSNFSRDWFFAHVPRNAGNNTYNPTTWQIKFDLERVNQTGHYTLQLALASAHLCSLQVRFNDPTAARPHFQTQLIGKGNSIARHGIHGLYIFYSILVLGQQLLNGQNTIYLTLSRVGSPFQGILYTPTSVTCMEGNTCILFPETENTLSHLSPASSSIFGDLEGLLDSIPWSPPQRRPRNRPGALHKNELFGFRYPVLAEKPEWWWRTLACVPYLIALQISDTGYFIQPFLERHDFIGNLIYFVPGAITRSPAWFIMIYCYFAYIGIVKNKDFPHFFRFHLMMGMLLETALQIRPVVYKQFLSSHTLQWHVRDVLLGRSGIFLYYDIVAVRQVGGTDSGKDIARQPRR
ncbi:hypothetical protein OIU74_027273 [Salix koriyanagi]|uniref:rhamnogalacturonan endolyase n=1 Tax=Salix koriyanagi TaxID=2511006 RepID=A0A9Q0W0Q9_9ROSI|nr:hypothetical protein OIU74_027273 [Salix koriyanagi]